MKHETEVAVLGGGVTGLCAAHYLSKVYGRDGVLLVEASDYVGGTTRTDSVDGFLLDWGPNGFLDREPKTLEWVAELGLEAEVVKANSAAARRFVMKNDELVEVIGPPRFLLSPLLSLRGRARLLCEPLIKAKRDDLPETIWDFAKRRIGREAADTLVAPMVSGVFGGDAKQLSLAHCFPRMAAMEREFGSLSKALMAKKRGGNGASAVGPSGVLTSFTRGIGQLPEQARKAMQDRVLAGTRVTRVVHNKPEFTIETDTGARIEARSVVIATPAFAAAEMVAELDSDASRALASIAYADIAVVCTGYRREQVGHDLNGFGFLVPRTQGKRALGCLWTSSIFPHEAPEGWVLLRTMIGGYTDPEGVRLPDSELLGCVEREIETLLKVKGRPEFVRIFRHYRGIPQYLLHHGDCLKTLDAAERKHHGLVFAGNAYRGVGLNDCVLSAHRAVEQLARKVEVAF